MALVRHTTEWLIRKNNVPVFCILFIAYSIQYQLLLSLTNFRKKKRSGKKYHIVGGNAYQSKEDSNDVDWTLNNINSLLISPAFHTRICIILILRNINLILVYLWRKYSRRHLTRGTIVLCCHAIFETLPRRKRWVERCYVAFRGIPATVVHALIPVVIYKIQNLFGKVD